MRNPWLAIPPVWSHRKKFRVFSRKAYRGLPAFWCGITYDAEAGQCRHLAYAAGNARWLRHAVSFPPNTVAAWLCLEVICAAAVAKPLSRAVMRLWRCRQDLLTLRADDIAPP